MFAVAVSLLLATSSGTRTGLINSDCPTFTEDWNGATSDSYRGIGETRGGSASGFTYAANNPLHFIDRDGLVITTPNASPRLERTLADLRSTRWGRHLYETLNRSPIEFRITEDILPGLGEFGDTGEGGRRAYPPGTEKGGTCGRVDIRIDPGAIGREYDRWKKGVPGSEHVTLPGVLGHEMTHAQDYLGGWPPVPSGGENGPNYIEDLIDAELGL